jgi:hypothetical protein
VLAECRYLSHALHQLLGGRKRNWGTDIADLIPGQQCFSTCSA